MQTADWPFDFIKTSIIFESAPDRGEVGRRVGSVPVNNRDTFFKRLPI
jgi:hypothetical protein